MQLREDLKEGGHRFTQVLLDHLLSNAQAYEGNEADGFHAQDSPGLGPTREPSDEGSEEAEHGQQDLVADSGQDVHEGGVREVHDDLLGQSHRCQQPRLLTAVQSTGA